MSETESDMLPRRIVNGDQRTRSQYWFEDGNIILEAENTLFRVHQSILSYHSQIFKDAFAIPHDASQENEYIEGCPVVPLSDSAVDLKNIISLLYDNDKTLIFGTKLPAKVLGSMLRLGRKYVITYLENEAIARLHHDYPKELEDWDSLSDDNRRQIEDTDFELTSTMEIISIAHEFQLYTILPAAYARYHQWHILEYLPDEEGIPKEARRHCIIANSRILAYIKDKIIDTLRPSMVLPSKTCTSGGKCAANRWNTIKNLPVWEIDESVVFGIYSCPKIKVRENLCSQCRTAVTTLIKGVRSEFWSMLPTFFNLPAWADLKDEA